MTQPAQAEFSKWRSYFWPVHSFELNKLVPMLLMMMLISFNYTVFRDTKDTLVVTYCGAQAIPFLKLWGVLPGAVIFTLLYAKLTNLVKREQLFYWCVIPFLIFYALFAFYLYPHRAMITPAESADRLRSWLPERFEVIPTIYQNWTLALFYVFAELWGSVCISLLFWGFANDTTRVGEAKRFYAMFGLGANFGSAIAGQIVARLADIGKEAGEEGWGRALQNTLVVSLICGVVILCIYYYLQNFVLTKSEFAPAEGETRKKTAKSKLSIRDSINLLANSRYLACIAVIVMAYGVTINLCETPWKNFLKEYCSSRQDYQRFMGNFSTSVSVITILMMLFVGGNVIRNLGWYVAAMFTPMVLVITGVIFFGLIIFKSKLGGLIGIDETLVLKLIVFIGAAQNIVSKASKYSLFDPTKEMTYIPLDADSRTKGKAAIDVVGARLGKSGGAAIFNILLPTFNNDFLLCAPYLLLALSATGVGWLGAVGLLSGEFAKLTSQKNEGATKVKA